MSDVSVNPKPGQGRSPFIPDWFERFYAGTPGGRAEEVGAPGTVPFSPVGQPEEERYGISALGGGALGFGRFLEEQGLNVADALGRFFTSRPQADYGQGLGSRAYSTGQAPSTGQSRTGTGFMDAVNQAQALSRDASLDTGRAPFLSAGGPVPTDWRAEAERILGGGPDYSAYRASLEDMVLNPQTGLSPRLQAMYNQLAEQAGANQQRISDIYGGASENVGSVYDTSAANVGDAFSSSQRQLADSLARLGIEEAAGQVMPQAAGRQASALAALEQGRAGGLSALERYGASSGDFASQMGQAAQQRGVEQNEFLLGALQRQLAESLGMEAQGAYDARLRAPGLARDLFEASQLGQPQGPTFEQQLAADRFAFDQGKTAADMQVEAQQNRNRRYQELFTFYNGNAQKAQEQVLFEIEQGLI
jgi:hypothetical protein